MGVPAHVTLAGDLSGEYLVEEVLEDGRLVIRPDTNAQTIRRRLDVEPVSRGEFEAELGHLPQDNEDRCRQSRLRPPARLEVRFDDLSFEEDLARSTKRGREVSVEASERLEREGADPSELLRCQSEHREGSELPNCVKTYLRPPDGRWGMVFELVRQRSTRKLVLAYLAPNGTPNPRRLPDVYRRAHERLHSARDREA